MISFGEANPSDAESWQACANRVPAFLQKENAERRCIDRRFDRKKGCVVLSKTELKEMKWLREYDADQTWPKSHAAYEKALCVAAGIKKPRAKRAATGTAKPKTVGRKRKSAGGDDAAPKKKQKKAKAEEEEDEEEGEGDVADRLRPLPPRLRLPNS